MASVHEVLAKRACSGEDQLDLWMIVPELRTRIWIVQSRFHLQKMPRNLLIPTNRAGLIEYRAHPFWGQKYCPSHEYDRTPRCCSCERMESRRTKCMSLGDGRSLCLECLDFAIMDTADCQRLYHSIRDYYEGMNMRLDQQIPILMVERQALNEAMEGEKDNLQDHSSGMEVRNHLPCSCPTKDYPRDSYSQYSLGQCTLTSAYTLDFDIPKPPFSDPFRRYGWGEGLIRGRWSSTPKEGKCHGKERYYIQFREYCKFATLEKFQKVFKDINQEQITNAKSHGHIQQNEDCRLQKGNRKEANKRDELLMKDIQQLECWN